jgi:hypothetical protein
VDPFVSLNVWHKSAFSLRAGRCCNCRIAGWDTLPYFYIHSIPQPCPKRKAAIFTGGLQKAVQNAKNMLFLLQKSVKAAFLSRVHKFGVQLFCTLTDCTNGVQKSGCTMQKIAVC